jgi:hypothetical protein
MALVIPLVAFAAAVAGLVIGWREGVRRERQRSQLARDRVISLVAYRTASQGRPRVIQ